MKEKHIGVIELEDTVRPSAADAIKKIKDQGVERTVLITGDAETPTQRIAKCRRYRYRSLQLDAR